MKGADYTIPLRDGGHSYVRVHGAMLLQVCREYSGIDIRTLTASEIRYLYEALRKELLKYTD